MAARGILRGYGAACVALAPLPEYALAGLRTGQFISGQAQLWSAEIGDLSNDAKK